MGGGAVETVKEISTYWAIAGGFLCAIFGAGGAWFVLRYQVKQFEKALQDLKTIPDRMNTAEKAINRLEDAAGRHVTISSCRDLRQGMLDQLMSIKKQLDRMDEKRESARVDQAKLATAIENLERAVRDKIRGTSA